MSEARRTLGCWLLAAFLGRGCDPTTARLPVAIPRVRPLTPGEAAALASRGGNLRVLPRPRRHLAAGASGGGEPRTAAAPAAGPALPPHAAGAAVLPFRRSLHRAC